MRAKVWGAPLLLLGLAPMLTGAPAHAAKGPYTIYASGVAPAYPSSLVGILTGCTDTFMTSPANGIDSYLAKVDEYANKPLTIHWDSPAVAPSAGSLASSYYDIACQRIPQFGDSSSTPGDWVQKVPLSAKFLLVTATGTGDVTFSLKP